MVVVKATQVVPGSSLLVHISLAIQLNHPSAEPLLVSLQPIPPIVTQEDALSPLGSRKSPTGAAGRCQYVLPFPLAGMFTGRVGRPKTIKGGEETETDPYKGGSQWERHPVSEASAEEEDEEDDVQELSDDEAGQEAPGPGSGQIDHIL